MADFKIFTPNTVSDATVKAICSEYGIYGKLISQTKPYTNNIEHYIYASLKEFSDDVIDVDCEKIIKRNAQNPTLFYPENIAIKVDGNNTFLSLEKLVDYCKEAEFISAIYKEFKVELPEKVRVTELYYLMDFNDGRYNYNLPEEYRTKYLTGLSNYFKNEGKNSKLYQEWRSFCRSDKFDVDGNKLKQLSDFIKRNEPETDLNSLFSTNNTVKKLEMQDHEYQKFREFMKDCYPDVTYHVSEKTIVDHGLIDKNNDDNNIAIDTPWGRCVTAKKFAEILEKDFADNGYAAISTLTPSYWEYRNIYYKECDEKSVISAYNSIRLAYAKCDSLDSIKSKGPIVLFDIPLMDFMNFVALAKSTGLHFYIDNIGLYAEPSLEQIHIIYPEAEHGLLINIIDYMLNDKVSNSHAIKSEQKNTLNKDSLSNHIKEATFLKIDTDKKYLDHDIER